MNDPGLAPVLPPPTGPHRRPGAMTVTLVLLEAAAFAAAAWLAPGEDVAGRFGFIPAEPTVGTALAALFVHVHPVHLLVSLVFLGMFGAALEASLGPVPVLACFLAAGLAGEYAHCLVEPGFTGLVVGASGAVSGLFGLHLALYGRATFVAWTWTWRGRRRGLDLSFMDALLMWPVAQGNLASYVMIGELPWARSVEHIVNVAGLATGLLLGTIIRLVRRRAGDLSRGKSGGPA